MILKYILKYRWYLPDNFEYIQDISNEWCRIKHDPLHEDRAFENRISNSTL